MSAIPPTDPAELAGLEPGFDIPALPGMTEAEIQTPCLLLDLAALERNVIRMGKAARAAGMRLRPHAKMHRSVDMMRLQLAVGGADGICCQKVAEAEVFARAGAPDILVSNQLRDPAKIDRLARLPGYGTRISVCVDDAGNVAALSEAARRHGAEIDCLVEIDCGAGRCGVRGPAAAVAVAEAVAAAPGLHFAGLQAYHGEMQHLETHAARADAFAAAEAVTRAAVEALEAAGLAPRIVSGGGTGSWRFEAASPLWNELQCGSYAFMDADYGRVRDASGARLDAGEWENALFVLSSVMSLPAPGIAICDAGLKSMSAESGLPRVFGREDARYARCSDEHGVLETAPGALEINARLRLVPGHCDPTCNLHDWYVGVRDGRVETLWPVSARGKSY